MTSECQNGPFEEEWDKLTKISNKIKACAGKIQEGSFSQPQLGDKFSGFAPRSPSSAHSPNPSEKRLVSNSSVSIPSGSDVKTKKLAEPSAIKYRNANQPRGGSNGCIANTLLDPVSAKNQIIGQRGDNTEIHLKTKEGIHARYRKVPEAIVCRAQIPELRSQSKERRALSHRSLQWLPKAYCGRQQSQPSGCPCMMFIEVGGERTSKGLMLRGIESRKLRHRSPIGLKTRLKASRSILAERKCAYAKSDDENVIHRQKAL
ncbi:hypothetical protein B0H14DRAFT_3611074 [Mycena olivaceomarginata]|nr:hypothetical protein B0H14DRAFT_3611074 [Mycena olivaceomarginata]